MADQTTPPRYRFNPATQAYELLTPATQPVDTTSAAPQQPIIYDGEGNPQPVSVNPSSSSAGIRSLPRYSYNPRTQRYTLLDSTQQAATPENTSGISAYRYNPSTQTYDQSSPASQNTSSQAALDAAMQQRPIDVDGGGDGAGSAGGGSSGPGSGGVVGDIGLGLMGFSESVPGIASTAMGVVGQAMADAAINSQAETDAAIAQANQQAQESTVSMGPFGPTVSTTTSISPVDDPSQVSVSSIGPSVSTTSMSEAVDAAEAEAAATDAANANADADSGTGTGDGDGGEGERAGGIISVMNTYAQGGMPDVARQVQSQGRGDDRVLVHMTPKEVQGLQYLAMRHGGSLTINPNTGLVEAGFLSRILPMLAGAALTATGVGAPMAALMVGGATGLATKSLSKGLMAGLGAFGGASLASGFSAAGASPALTGTQAGLTSAGEMAASNIAPEAAQALSYGDKIGMGIQSPYFQAAQSNIDPGMLQGMTAEQVAGAPVLSPTPGTMPPAAPFGQSVQQMGRGFSNVFGTGTEADAARAAFMKDVGGVPGLARTSLAGLTSLSAADSAPPPALSQARIRPYRYDPGRQVVGPKTGTSESRYFAPRYTPLGVFKPGEEPATYALGGGINMGGRVDQDYNQNVDANSAFSDDFYGGGLTALAAGGRPNKPRFLVGKGDGMSDSIPATINDVQPARLADGEFVVPADVVSHLGNGSSKAGAAKLHAMMDRIRKVRTGKQRQAPEVKAERYMPA